MPSLNATLFNRRNTVFGLSVVDADHDLQGGYNLTSIANSAAACVSTLLGDPLLELNSAYPSLRFAVYACTHMG